MPNDELPVWRRFYGAAERASFRMILGTGPLMRWIARPLASAVDGRTLAPEIATLVRLDNLLNYSGLLGVPPDRARRKVATGILVIDAPAPPGVAHEDREYPAPAGARRIRHYAPSGLAAPSPAVVYFHGGGWVTGSIGSHDDICRKLAARVGCRVLSVDYRLAPEHRFPAAAEDCEAAYRWVVAEAASLGIDPTRVAVAGDSAGGNLSAVVSQRTGMSEYPPKLAVLMYPALDMTAKMRSHETVGDKYVLTSEMCEWYYAHYMGDADRRDPRASPLLSPVLPKVPTFVFTCGFDPLRDEGRAYAERLRAAGVRCGYKEFPDLVHGFALMTNVTPALGAFVEVLECLRREL